MKACGWFQQVTVDPKDSEVDLCFGSPGRQQQTSALRFVMSPETINDSRDV
jgi:hypothetical protein